MLLGISAIGWVLLTLVYLPITIFTAFWARKRWEEHRPTVVVVGALLFAPLVAMVIEAAYVDWRFRSLCKEAKTTITRKVVVDGFYDDGGWIPGYGDHNDFLDPYDFIEWRDSSGRIMRTERGEGEKSRTVQIDKPSARYHWLNQRKAMPIGHLLARREETAVDSHTGEVIGRYVAFERRLSFIDAAWIGPNAPPEFCRPPGTMRLEVLVGTHNTARK